ncbi:hypothetical protein BDK51DRAFT_47573 [Blyttiomyces helicus]|uniref:G-protein coupled receptors family 1 profile domain-containing protein n=1 Tax=Blyttiomyces helicus TaxID=388810 RepID=A0A4P9W0X8_9FUNG|nr:hypothetical protein BDK51DRAFT_47573 [Blyttiomyces helicus]|eukprot:RKO85809.1 hypothetical protein BDK51DRAFT_47573 [Blyttiomyces helicus]
MRAHQRLLPDNPACVPLQATVRRIRYSSPLIHAAIHAESSRGNSRAGAINCAPPLPAAATNLPQQPAMSPPTTPVPPGVGPPDAEGYYTLPTIPQEMSYGHIYLPYKFTPAQQAGNAIGFILTVTAFLLGLLFLRVQSRVPFYPGKTFALFIICVDLISVANACFIEHLPGLVLGHRLAGWYVCQVQGFIDGAWCVAAQAGMFSFTLERYCAVVRGRPLKSGQTRALMIMSAVFAVVGSAIPFAYSHWAAPMPSGIWCTPAWSTGDWRGIVISIEGGVSIVPVVVGILIMYRAIYLKVSDSARVVREMGADSSSWMTIRKTASEPGLDSTGLSENKGIESNRSDKFDDGDLSLDLPPIINPSPIILSMPLDGTGAITSRPRAPTVLSMPLTGNGDSTTTTTIPPPGSSGLPPRKLSMPIPTTSNTPSAQAPSKLSPTSPPTSKSNPDLDLSHSPSEKHSANPRVPRNSSSSRGGGVLGTLAVPASSTSYQRENSKPMPTLSHNPTHSPDTIPQAPHSATAIHKTNSIKSLRPAPTQTTAHRRREPDLPSTVSFQAFFILVIYYFSILPLLLDIFYNLLTGHSVPAWWDFAAYYCAVTYTVTNPILFLTMNKQYRHALVEERNEWAGWLGLSGGSGRADDFAMGNWGRMRSREMGAR